MIGAIVCSGLGGVFFDDPPKPIVSPRQQVTIVETTLTTGNGHNWNRLSATQKMELGELAASRLGKKNAVYYVNYLNALYVRDGTAGEDQVMNMSVREALAVAAVWKD